MTTALVTRPREDAQGLTMALRERGLDVVVEPLLEIAPVSGVTLPISGVQGILATSANGVRALARELADRTLPVWAVGDASARLARELGYQRVESAGGDVGDLVALVAARCRPEAGAFLHAAGSVTAGDLAGQLSARGFEIRRVVLYQACPATVLSEALLARLRRGGVDVALFFSPRTAATFVTLVKAAGAGETSGAITAYALSAAVARELAALPWLAVRQAEAPTQAALLAALDHDLQRGSSMSDSEQPKPDQDNGKAAMADPMPEPAAESTAAVDASTEPSGDTTPATPDKAAPRRSGRGMILVLAVVLVVLVAAAGAITFEQWKAMVLPAKTPAPPVQVVPSPSFRPATDVDGVRAELNALRDRVAQVEARPQATDAAVLAQVEDRLGKAEGGIESLQARPQVPAKLVDDVAALGTQLADLKKSSADAAAVLRLADRVEKVEAEMRELQARRSSAVAVLLAVGQLRDALARAMPYDAELRALLALAGSDPEVVSVTQPLKARSVVGIPTMPTLVSRFERMAPDLVRAQMLPDEQTWWRQTLERLMSLVTVRREDGAAAGSSNAAIVARVQGRLAEDDLEHAAAEAAGLQGVAADIAAPWLADVQARLAADKVASELTAHVVAQVGARP